MKKPNKFIIAMAVSTLCLPAFALPVHAMDWRDGAQASQTFTYTETAEGIKSVYVQDKNGTVSTEIKPNTSVKSKTGTITWRDSYENVTSFYVDVMDGYDVKVLVNGQDGELFDTSAAIDVKVNSDLGKDNTYTVGTKDGYEKVFYFSSAGKEAWVKNPNISFETEKISYSLTNNEGAVLGTAAIGDVPTIDESKFMQTGKTITGYTINNVSWTEGNPITEQMIENASAYDGNLMVEAQYTVNSHQVTINYYDGGMVSGNPSKTTTVNYEYAFKLNKESLQLEENQYIAGANEVVMPDEDITINIVSRPTQVSYKEWAFTYVGNNDPHVQGVTVQWNKDNSSDKSFSLNETATLATPGTATKCIKFFVMIDKEYEPTGKLSGGSDITFNKLSDLDNGTLYEMEFKRRADHTIDKNPAHETFTIETVSSVQ